MRLSLIATALLASPALAHDGHLHAAHDSPFHHLVTPLLIIALCAVVGAVAHYARRRK